MRLYAIDRTRRPSDPNYYFGSYPAAAYAAHAPFYINAVSRRHRWDACNDELRTNVGGCDAWRYLNVDEDYIDDKTSWGRFEEIEAVILAAKVGKVNDPKATLLHWAARCNKTWPITQFFKDPACDVMALDSEGRTALEVAIEFNVTGRFSAAARLLKAYIEEHKLVKPTASTKSAATAISSTDISRLIPAPIPTSSASISASNGKATVDTVASQKELTAEKAETARLKPLQLNAEKTALAKQALADKEVAATKEKAVQVLKAQQVKEAQGKEIIATVLYDFEPGEKGDLQLIEGELIKITSHEVSGWWEGISLKTGKSGLFPANYVEIINPPTNLSSSSTQQTPKLEKEAKALAESARLEQLRLDAEKAALAKQALAEKEAAVAKEKAAQALKAQQVKEAQDKEIQAKKEAEAIAAKQKAEKKVMSEITKLSQEIQAQDPSAILSPENILALNAKVELLNQKVADLQSSKSLQLSPQNQKILDQFAKDEVWLTLLRFGQGLQQQDKTLAFFQKYPVLWETYLTLITILSNQFLSAKILHSKILDVKAKGWFKEQGLASNLLDAFAGQLTNLADLANIPLLSGAAKGIVKAYDSYSQNKTRELFNPLIEYAPTLTDQDKLIQQIAFLTLARFHELLLLAEKIDSKDLLNSLGNGISEKLNLSELKQKFNTLLKREDTAEKKDATALMGTLFGEFFADKLMEIILSEYEETAYNKAKKTRDFGDLILAWLRSDTWGTLNVSVAGKEYDLESTEFAKLLHVNDAKIIWDGASMTIVEAIRASGFKHYQPTTQWAYKNATTDQPETVGYLYEMDPSVFQSELFLASNKHADFSTRETKRIITDAENHYASLPVLVSTPANTPSSTPSSRSSSSPPASLVDDSVSTREAALSTQEIMRMLTEQAARMAAIEADKKASEEKNKELVQQLKEAHAKTIQLETKMKKVEKKVSVLDDVDVDNDIDAGDGQVLLKKTKTISSTTIGKSTGAQSDRAAIAQLTERLNDQAVVVATIAEHTGLGFLSKPKKEPTAREIADHSELLSQNSPR
jgi:hypothetical protein